MRKIVLASHGSLAEGMLSAVNMILSDQEGMVAYGLDRHETPQNILAATKAYMAENPQDNFLVLCDIKGGSVYNQLLQLCQDARVTMFTGMNLNLVLELAMPRPGIPWAQEREQALKAAQSNICYYDQNVLEQMEDEQENEEDDLW